MGLGMFERLCIRDAAKRMGVSVDTVRRRIKAKGINAQRDNSGQWWVLLPMQCLIHRER
jgi:excisionase family DNA binding protein